MPEPEAPTAEDIDPAVRARMDACLDDTSRSDADLRLMRGNLLNVIDGMLPHHYCSWSAGRELRPHPWW